MRLTTLLTMSVAAPILLGASCSRSIDPPSNGAAPPLPEDMMIFDFSQDDIDKIPSGFTADLTGNGEPGEWQVQQVEDAGSGIHVLVQLSNDPTNNRYPHIVLDGFAARNVDLSVRFRTLSGEVDASAGLIFRYSDRDNYYVVRANALENNVVAYKTQNGSRTNIGVTGAENAYGVRASVTHQSWNTLRVIVQGSLIEVYFNGNKLFDIEDDSFADAGSVGLWTKADAITQFDDFRVKQLPEPVP